MIGRLIIVCCLLIAFTPVSFAGTVDCKKDKIGKEDHCKNAVAGDQYQCTTYVKQQVPWVKNLAMLTLKDKKSHITSKTQACVGGVVVVNEGSYGHVGIVEADLGSKIKIRDRNYCCDGADRIHEISVSKVAGYICQPQSQSHTYHIRITNIDDIGECFVNGHKVASVGYYKDTGWVDITKSKYLRNGENEIKFKVTNNGGGYTYYFGVKENGHIKWEKKCGEVGRKGCTKDDLPKGKSLTKEYTFKL